MIVGLKTAYEAIVAEVPAVEARVRVLWKELENLQTEWGNKRFKGVKELREIGRRRFNLAGNANLRLVVTETSFNTVREGRTYVEDALSYLSYWRAEISYVNDDLKKARELIAPELAKQAK